MPARPEASEFERLVKTWQGPVYHLAWRMLGNAADAEDATQEAFVRLFQQVHRFDPARGEMGAWVHRVATRVVLNRIRRDRPRRRAEEVVRGERRADGSAPEEVPVDRAEEQRVVEEHLRRLPGPERAALVLRYHLGLSTTEVADALEVPRTTIASRIDRALASLRASLKAGHAAALAPMADGLLLAAPAPSLPPSLESALLATAAKAAAAAGTGSLLVLGGLVVSKKIAIAMFAVAAAGLLGTGYVAGHAQVLSGGDDASSLEPSTQTARLAEENARLRDEVARLRGPTLAGSPRAPMSGEPSALDGASAAAASPEGASAGTASAGEAKPGAEKVVDWSTFGTLLAASLDALVEARGKDEESLDPETQKKGMAILAELMRATTEARALSPRPFFDARVLPGLVDALFGPTLGLSREARDALDRKVRDALERAAADLDAAEGLPLETHVVRVSVADQILAAAREGVPAGSEARFAGLESIARSLLDGDQRIVSISLHADGPPGGPSRRVLERWRDDHDLDDRQAEALAVVAGDFARAAADAVRRAGLDVEGADADAETERRVEREVLGLQVEAERRVRDLLTPQQRERARRAPPSRFRFHGGTEEGMIVSSSGGI